MSKPDPRPVLVYLDQSDWSNLQHRHAPQAEQQLRDLGARGSCAILVSTEHFVETFGLRSGREERLRYLREFDGTFWVTNTVDDVLSADCLALAAHAGGVDYERVALGGRALASLSDGEIHEWANQLPATVRPLTQWAVMAEQMSRVASRGYSKDERRASERAAAALLAGDVERFIAAANELGPRVGRVRRLMLERLVPLIGRAAQRVRRLGFMGPLGRRDPTFDRCVMPWLPTNFRRNPDAVAKIAASWKRKEVRSLVAPSLATHAAVVDSVDRDLARRMNAGDRTDARHAAYAPYVDLFTCDKRNVGPIERALQGGGHAVEIRRCSRLDETAERVTAILEDRVRPRDA